MRFAFGDAVAPLKVVGPAPEGKKVTKVTFLPSPATFKIVEFDFEHLDGDEVWRKGRAVGATVNGRLYLILLDAARSHYYGAALPDYEAIVASARLKL